MESSGAEAECTLQSLHQSHVFSDVVVLAADPLRDPDWSIFGAPDYYANAGRAGAAQAASINVCDEVWHEC